MEDQKPKLSWGFWLQWVLGNTVGWIVGMVFFIYLGELVDSLTTGLLEITAWGIFATIAGFSVGVNQWFVLKLYQLPDGDTGMRWWVVATLLGWVPSMVVVVGMGVGEELNYASSGAIIGITMGIAQWFVLRRHVKNAEWWPLATTIGWMAGMAPVDHIDLAVGFLLSGIISGMITGGFLIWLLRRPLDEETQEE